MRDRCRDGGEQRAAGNAEVLIAVCDRKKEETGPKLRTLCATERVYHAKTLKFVCISSTGEILLTAVFFIVQLRVNYATSAN